MSESVQVQIERAPPLLTVTINRPLQRNAVDGATAAALAQAFTDFDADAALSVAVLTGAGGHFCAGADLKAVASGDPARMNRIAPDGPGPMGPTRMQLSKPVIAAISGYAVAGGLELAAWCDLRVAEASAQFGVSCRRFGVPLIDGGTLRLPRLIGANHALDLILTGRMIDADEALRMGLVNRVVADGQALLAAQALARQIAAFPQTCLRNDRASVAAQWHLSVPQALAQEFEYGLATLRSGETQHGALRFTQGDGRHGHMDTP